MQASDESLYLPSFNNATHPSDKNNEIVHIFAIDSRQRDYSVYPKSNNYNIQIPDTYKNVTSIELKAAMLPRTEYNINSMNKYLDLTVGDYINKISYKKKKITDGNNAINTGKHILTIDKPHFPNGIQCEIEVELDLNYRIINYTIINPGSGYSSSNSPKVSLYDYNDFTVDIGVDYISELREGQYTIGGNPVFENNTQNNKYQSWTPSNLINELENAMSYSILKDTKYCYSRKSWTSLNKNSTQSDIENYENDYPLLFTSRIMSQYPTLETYSGNNDTPECYNTNSCKFNRIYFSNVLILKTDSSPTEGQLNGTSTFKDYNNFEYSILKYTLLPGTIDKYIIYCKLVNSLNTVNGNYWSGVSEGDMNGDFSANFAHWEFKFATGRNVVVNSAGLLGFNKINYVNSVKINTISTDNITLLPSSLTYSTENDYNLVADPEYIMLSFRPKYGGNTLDGINERVDSTGYANIDGVFACLIFDNVYPSVLQDLSSGKSISNVGSISEENNKLGTFINNSNGIDFLTGNTGSQNTSFSRSPGLLKAMKGSDFDKKIYTFSQPVAQVWEMNIRFTKFSKGAIGSDEELYNFQGKEHLLIFEITCGDPLTGRRN